MVPVRETSPASPEPLEGQATRTPLALLPVLLLAALLCGGAAEAADWYVAGYLGGAATSDAWLELTDRRTGETFRFEPVTFEGRSFESPLYYGFRGGVCLPGLPNVAVEAEFIHLKVYADGTHAVARTGGGSVAMPTVVEAFAMSHGMNLLLVNVAVRRPVRGAGTFLERIVLSGRAGAGPAIPHVESRVRGVRREGYEVAGLGFQVGGGIEWRFSKRAALLAEYKFTRATPRVGVDGAEVEGPLGSHHLVAGLVVSP